MLKHKGSIPLSTDRLSLRAFKMDDAEPMFRNWANDPEVTRFLTWEPHGKIEVTKHVVADWVVRSKNKDNYHWLIEMDGEAIGSAGAVVMDLPNESCEIGYCLAKEYWGQGIMTEAVAEIIRYLFSEVGFHRITSKHDVLNPASGMVMKKCGMVFEGISREASKRKDGSFGDFSNYAILKSEAE